MPREGRVRGIMQYVSKHLFYILFVLLQICCMEPLRVSQTTVSNVCSHPACAGLLFAMASMSKVSVVALRPELHVLYKRPLTGSPNTLPLLAWQFVSIRISETERTTDPVLLFARDQYACFLQVASCQPLFELRNLCFSLCNYCCHCPVRAPGL